MVPPIHQHIEVPTLLIASVREAFYKIYTHSWQVPEVNYILQELDFHPLSTTLLTEVAV